MTATGNEAVRLSQLKTLIDGPVSSSAGASGSEAVTIDQAADALGLETAGGATGQRAITLSQLKMAYEYNPLEIVAWADGTDEQIAAMVAAADAGKIVLSDYWSAGDTRTVRLSAMAASSGTGETHAAQDVQFVLTDPGHYMLANGKPCNFVVLQKDCLKETGVMNKSRINEGGWNNCARRAWCNGTYRNAIPSSLRGIFKQFKTRAASGGGGSSAVNSTDWFSLFSEKEIFGSTRYADYSAEIKNSQLDWFKTPSNRVKKRGMWWERSPDKWSSTHFCHVESDGSADYGFANLTYGIAPFGCI